MACVAWVIAILLLAPTAGEATGPGRRGPATQAPAGQASRDWRRFESANFVAFGNATRDDLRRAVVELEAFRAMLLQLFPTLRLTSPVPTRVVVFKDVASFSRFRPRDARGKLEEWVGGYFTPQPDVNYLVVAGGASGLQLSIVFHEYTHYVLHRNLPSIPMWLDEGLSDFYSTFQPAREKGWSQIGAVPPGRAQVLTNGSLFPLEKVLSTQGALKILQDPSSVPMFYAESWMLVHYLTLGQGGKRQGQIGAYMKALQKGLPFERAFTEAFQCTYDQLESELRTYVNARTLPGLGIRRASTEALEAADMQPMLQADADALQADLLSRLGSGDDAEKAANRALALDPEHPQARLALAKVRLGQGRSADAIALLETLVDKPSVGLGAQMALASALIDAGRYEEAVQPAERAVQLNDQAASAWYALSLAFAVLDRDRQADSAMLRYLELEPSPESYHTRAYYLFRLGKDGAAARDAKAFLERAGWGHESAPYVAFLSALAYRRLGQNADADAVLERARPTVTPGSWTEKVLDYMQRRLTADAFLSRARENGEKTEAHTYVGFDLAMAGKRDEAVVHFKWVQKQGSRNYVEYTMAVAELERLEKPSAAR
jgi:tetratricopeptide (TPR) repeat protein